MTMTNAEWCIKNGYKFSDLWIVRDCLDDDDYERTYIITISGKDLYKYITTNELSYLEVMLKWLDMEYEGPILDDAEKNYLSAVIAPFRDRVQYIAKVKADPIARLYENDICVDIVNHYIVIHFNDSSDDMNFPVFREGTMYKGMEIGHEYSLEELGL